MDMIALPSAPLPLTPKLRLLLILLLMGLGCMSHVVPAQAHAALVSAEPADGAVLPRAPAMLTLTFSEPVSPLVLRIIAPDGTRQSLDHFVLRDRRLEIDAPPALGEGTHVLSWRVISEDGHPVGGSVVFSIGAPSGATAVPSGEGDSSVARVIWAMRILFYAGLFAGIGGAFCLAWLTVPARDGEAAIGLGLVLGAGAALLSVGLQGADALEVPLGSLANGLVWETGFSTSFGQTVLGAILATVLAGASLVVPAAAARGLSLLALATLGAALAASGHAGAASPQWLTRPAVFLHAVGIAAWVGSLVPLGLLFMRRKLDATAGLRRFSVFIPFAVLPLLASGMLLAVIQLARPSALWETDYGRVLAIKLVLLAALFALAAFNRRRLTEPALRGEPRACRQLSTSIWVEIVLALAIFGAASLWRFTPPPRALEIAAAEPATLHLHSLKAMADLTVAPGRAGPVDLGIVLMTGEFGPLDAKEVGVVFSSPALGIEPIRRKAERRDGVWGIDGLVIPAPGDWTVGVDILISDFELVRLNGALHIRR